MEVKVVYKNRKTGLYFIYDMGYNEETILKNATICSINTKWSYDFYQIYEQCLYSDELKLERKNKLLKLNEYKNL